MNLVTQIVDKQLKAYNQLDFETFASCYHENIKSYELETQAQLENMCGDKFFLHYKEKFKKNPEIFCKVTERIVHDDLVIDKEYITTCKGRNHKEMVIYKVEDGLITKMWFSKEIIEEQI
jgi:hypothetical protein